ncbi:MAG: response regulator [Acidobacteriota bacterium]
MEHEFRDLIPLFVSETRGRIERLASLARGVESEPRAVAEARRELHTIKGAGRMLQIAPLAELCHLVETALPAPGEGAGALLTRVTDCLTVMVEAVARGEEPVADPELLAFLKGERPTAVTPAPGPPAPPADAALSAPTADIRIEAAVVDGLADRATRLKILALGATGYVASLHEMAHLAEAVGRDPQPQVALAGLAAALHRLAVAAEGSQHRLRRLAEAQLEATLALQVQPLRSFMLSLARHARELARSLGREVEVTLAGEETRLDRRIAADLEEALLHLVRNAVDHGIEAPEVRETHGKQRVGKLGLRAEGRASRVLLTISDDGGGIDPASIGVAAVAAGLIDDTAARALTSEDAFRLLFTPGFSTRGEVSEVSGRGVGLDAVAHAASRVGGEVRLSSRPGQGTTVVVEVPVARRGEEVVLLGVGQARVALPAAIARQVSRLRPVDVIERGAVPFARRPGRLVPFVPLSRLLGEPAAPEQLLIEGEAAGQSIALAADAILGQEEVLLRPLPRSAAGARLYDGVALTAAGEPIGVLSPAALAQHDLLRATLPGAERRAPHKLRVLLVDDSLVTREMERRLLDDAGFDVVVAADAAEALRELAETPFDCVVTDVEMPAMDGLELTRQLRGVPAFAHLPVVIVSTRDHPEDRLRGLQAGADAYLTKQGLDASELVAVVQRLGWRR